MKVAVSWLREFVDLPESPEEIARVLSVRGFAVEGIDVVEQDTVLDFEITANRPDCMSVVGIAREVATAYQRDLRIHEEAPPTAGGGAMFAALTPGDDPQLGVAIERPDLCPRYVGAVADVRVGPSPAWMQTRLQAAGIRPISNIVDITNYVLVELGHPMHAFDHAQLAGPQIRVRTALPGESLRTLDGQTRGLTPDMLIIADAERATAVAGVMGGGDSEVTAGTTTIVFESACFDPLSVRRTSKALGLKTEASMRFERGADVQLPSRALARACALLESTGSGRARGLVVDAYPSPRDAAVVRLRRARIGRLLGTNVDDVDVTRILGGLGFEPAPTADGWNVGVPTRRVDIRREVDLIEEVARHYGLDRLPTTFPVLSTAPPVLDPKIKRARLLRSVLTAAGFSEAVTFGFVSEVAAAPFTPADDLVPIANPLSETFAVLRPSALPGLVDALAHNRRREQRDTRLFEIGARFTRQGGERSTVACAWGGAATLEHWSGGRRQVDFFDIAAVAGRICDALRVDVRTEPEATTWLVPGRAAALVNHDTRIGVLGQLAPAVAERHGLPGAEAVYVADIDLDAVEHVRRGADWRIASLPRYPSVTRDISILLDDTIPAAAVRAAVRDAAPATLAGVTEFDRYQGKGIPENKVSLSLHLTFRSPTRTLTDAEVQVGMEAVLDALRTRLGAEQR